MPSLFRFLSTWPLGLLHWLGAVLGWLVFALSPTYRRRFVQHARLAGYRFGQVRGAVAHAGRMAAELPRLWLGAPIACEAEGVACVQDAWAAGRGIVFLTPHLGCFELSAQYAARTWGATQGAITVLYRPARQRWLAAVMAQARQRPHLHTAPATLSGVRQMIKALRRGESVGLLPDQVPPLGQGLWAPFFGQPAYTMTLAARLARQTGAALIVARCERTGGGRPYRLSLEPLALPEPAELAADVACINQAMERAVRQCPSQYLWGYARYKQPRGEAAAAAEAQP